MLAQFGFVISALAAAQSDEPQASAQPVPVVTTAESFEGAPRQTQKRQKKRQDLTVEEQIDKHIQFARTGSARIRPQAANKLVRLGEPAAQRLLQVTGKNTEQLALLGTSLIEVLGMFENQELRAKLWPAIDDSEFPWRPASARSLAYAPQPAERARFISYLNDPIAPVRVACLDALFRLTVAPDPTVKRTDEEKAVHETDKLQFLRLAADQLDDENDVVRRRAAILLDARGHRRALLWLVEDMKRDDAFFDRPSGLMARYESSRLLRERGINVDAYVPELPTKAVAGSTTGDNSVALAAITKAITGDADKRARTFTETEQAIVPREVPPIAQAVASTPEALLGLELKSCRRGDFFLRWTADDLLLIGDGNPAVLQLPEGTTAKLIAASRDTQLETGDSVFWGQPGCDSEQYRMPRIGDAPQGLQHLTIAKGEEKVVDLRPGAVRQLGAAMLASLPKAAEGAQDPRIQDLRLRVEAAFASIGGSVVPKAKD